MYRVEKENGEEENGDGAGYGTGRARGFELHRGIIRGMEGGMATCMYKQQKIIKNSAKG